MERGQRCEARGHEGGEEVEGSGMRSMTVKEEKEREKETVRVRDLLKERDEGKSVGMKEGSTPRTIESSNRWPRGPV